MWKNDKDRHVEIKNHKKRKLNKQLLKMEDWNIKMLLYAEEVSLKNLIKEHSHNFLKDKDQKCSSKCLKR